MPSRRSGAATGGLASAVLQGVSGARVTVLDVDAAVHAEAHRWWPPTATGASFHKGNRLDPLPRADAVPVRPRACQASGERGGRAAAQLPYTSLTVLAGGHSMSCSRPRRSPCVASVCSPAARAPIAVRASSTLPGLAALLRVKVFAFGVQHGHVVSMSFPPTQSRPRLRREDDCGCAIGRLRSRGRRATSSRGDWFRFGRAGLARSERSITSRREHHAVRQGRI